MWTSESWKHLLYVYLQDKKALHNHSFNRNSALQCLFYTPELIDKLANYNSIYSYKRGLSFEIVNLYNQMNSNTNINSFESPENLKLKIGKVFLHLLSIHFFCLQSRLILSLKESSSKMHKNCFSIYLRDYMKN